MNLPALPGLPEQGYWACPEGPEEIRFRFNTGTTPPTPKVAFLTCPHGRWTNLETAQTWHRLHAVYIPKELTLTTPERDAAFLAELTDVMTKKLPPSAAFCPDSDALAMPAWQNGHQIEHYRCVHGFWHSLPEAEAAHTTERELIEYTELPPSAIDSAREQQV